MILLPGFIVGLVLAVFCFGHEHEVPLNSASTGQSPKCPGACQEDGSCITALSETDCAEGLICCVDHLEKMDATEFSDESVTSESMLDSNVVKEILETSEELSGADDTALFESEETESEETESEESDLTGYEEGGLTSDGRYEILYSEETGETILSPIQTEELQASEATCPGTCVTPESVVACAYVSDDPQACPDEAICCLTAEDVQDDETFEVVDEQSSLTKRSTDDLSSQMNCPGTCVHPMHTGHCQKILSQFSCPLNTKCCMFPTTSRSSLLEPTVCLGICVPFRMTGYCLPPNEIVMGPSNCPAGQSCCMRNPTNVKPPQAAGMSFPAAPNSNLETTADILGHLAVDEVGTVFKVSNRGQVSPLPRLPPNSNVRNFIRLATYPRSDGEIVIYSDNIGTLFQEFYRIPSVPGNTQSDFNIHRPPINEFQSQASNQPSGFQQQPNKDLQTGASSSSSDIVIPEDDDEAPVSPNKPSVTPEKSPSPPCPGSCMSYFLRFTCFRGYAIYDGFTCPGRSVCCARLKDIEDHEQYLKSLTPYFNVPPASRDPALPRCGIKGRRDTPRIIGGKESLPGEWCWQVAVINLQNQYICGGALIDNSWVLTAAHCVVGPMEQAQALFVRAGVTDLKSAEDNSKAQTIRVLSTFVHHNFNSLNLDNNIALLRLQKPVELDSNACVVCLPTSRKMPPDDTKCTVTGYGFVSPDGSMSLRIKEAKVPIVDDMECMTNVTEALDNAFILPASSFCAGGAGQADACQGDAGGALVCELGGFHELVGLVSWGLGCGRESVPSIYIKVPAFMGWINQIISSSSFFIP